MEKINSITFELDESKNLLPNKITKLENTIRDLSKQIQKNVQDYSKFLNEKQATGEYMEIHQPFFSYEITIIYSKPTEKFLISVLDHKNYRVCGNLIIENLPCLSILKTKELVEWKNYQHGGKYNVFSKLLPRKITKLLD